MQNISKSICAKFKDARRALGLSQTDLAAAVGCKQAALSMFEGGQVTKVSEEVVRKLAGELKLDLDALKREEKAEPAAAQSVVRSAVRGFCPNCECLSNVPFAVDGRIVFFTNRSMASPGGGRRCAICGEVLEQRCPSCGAALNEGACCTVCGVPYITASLPDGVDLSVWAKARRDEISEIRSFL